MANANIDTDSIMHSLAQLQSEMQLLKNENEEMRNNMEEDMDEDLAEGGNDQEEINWCDVLPSSKLIPSVPAAKLLSSLLEKPPPFALVKLAETEGKRYEHVPKTPAPRRFGPDKQWFTVQKNWSIP